jgi:class 3 adenylate cyclase
MDDHDSFGALLKRYRVAAGLTQEALAERAGLSADAISTLERGLRLAPRRDTVRLLTDALRLSAGDRALLEGSVQRHRGPPQAAALLPAVASSPPHLAAPAAMGETRVLTVLCADLTGSVTSTAHMHPEDAAARINDALTVMVAAILPYAGHIDRLSGDAVLAFFGTPQAHENDPERAVLAALDVREAVQQQGLNVAIGINTGAVYLGTVGSERHQEVTAQGPVVSVAARLREAAQPGQILVGEAVYRSTRRAFACAPLCVEAKGSAQPVAAYEVLRPVPHAEKVRGIEGVRAPLIGRDAEFAQLKEALAAHYTQGQVLTSARCLGSCPRWRAWRKAARYAQRLSGPYPNCTEGGCHARCHAPHLTSHRPHGHRP